MQNHKSTKHTYDDNGNRKRLFSGFQNGRFGKRRIYIFIWKGGLDQEEGQRGGGGASAKVITSKVDWSAYVVGYRYKGKNEVNQKNNIYG